jgi:hypothetical protein
LWTVNKKYFFMISLSLSLLRKKRTTECFIPQARSSFLLLKPASEHAHARLLPRLSWSWTLLLPSDKKLKGKAVPESRREGPQAYEMSRLPNFLDNRPTDRGEVFSLTLCRPLSPGRFLVVISVRGWVDLRVIVRLERLGKLENPMTSSGIEPAIFRLVA